MHEKELVKKLRSLSGFTIRMGLTPHLRDDFVGFAAEQFVRGRSIHTSFYLIYVDFLRSEFGRTYPTRPTRRSRTEYIGARDFPGAFSEDAMIAKIDASHQVSRIMHMLPLEDRELLKLIFFKDMTYIEVARAIGKSEATVCLRVHRIFAKVRRLKTLAHKEVAV